ncbi:MAG: alpha-amylase family glycosyl hydrolase [Candidatus Paceibacterota bacterium]
MMHNNDYWWKNSVIYEVYVDRFAGTFTNFSNKLDYLKFLGVDCIHLLPHYPSPMIDEGYDITDYLGIREDLGTLDDFKDFMKKAHDIGIRVIIDFVLNHTSTNHPWFVEARSSVQNDKRDFYLWSKTGEEFAEAPNLFPDLKSKNWIYNEQTDDYYFSTFHIKQVDLNWENPRVFSEMMNVIDFWVNIGVDGFRLDAVSHVIKKEGTTSTDLPETHTLVKKIRSHIDQNHHNIIILGEVCDSVEKTKEYFGDGDECHLIYLFPLLAQLMLVLKRNDPALLQDVIETSAKIPESCAWVTFFGHHDEMTIGTLRDENEREEVLSYFDPEKKYRFAGGLSLRPATALGGNKEKIIEAYKMFLNVPGSPIIYYGDEIGMENVELLPEEKDTRKSVRGKFDWDSANTQRLDPNSILAGISEIIKNRKK